MKSSHVCALAAVVVLGLFGRVGFGALGTTSTLYLTNYAEFGGGNGGGLDLVQGVTETSFPTSNMTDICIGVYGDVRTFGYSTGDSGSRFSLTGLPLPGGPYLNNLTMSQFHDGTADALYNYSIDYPSGSVVRFDKNWGSATVLFNVPAGTAGWITMNAGDSTFWLSQYGFSDLVEHRTYGGALISSFNSGINGSQGLALDPIDGTLWMSSGMNLIQFSQTGTMLQAVPFSLPGQWYGMEFDTTPVAEPEPGSLALLTVGAGVMLVRRRRRGRCRRPCQSGK